MTTLILGAGYLGSAIGTALAASGDKVVCVRRHAIPHPGSSLLGLGISSVLGYVVGDLRDKGMSESVALAAAKIAVDEPFDKVIVSIAPSGRTDDGNSRDFLRAIVGAVEVARRLEANELFYSSSTGVYLEQNGGFVDEASPLAEGCGRGVMLVEAEQLIAGAGIDSCIFRLSGIYGPGREPISRYQNPDTLALGGEFWTNRIRVEDIVSAFMLRSLPHEQEIEQGGVYNCTDDCPVKAIDVARWIALRQGRTWTPLQFVKGDDRPRSNKRVSNVKLKALGWTPNFVSYKEGMEEFL